MENNQNMNKIEKCENSKVSGKIPEHQIFFDNSEKMFTETEDETKEEIITEDDLNYIRNRTKEIETIEEAEYLREKAEKLGKRSVIHADNARKIIADIERKMIEISDSMDTLWELIENHKGSNVKAQRLSRKLLI